MKFENTRVMNFEGAFRGLRNPLESWERSDSSFGLDDISYCEEDWEVATSWVQFTTNYDYQKDYDFFEEEKINFSQWLINNGVINQSLDKNIIEYAFIGPKDMDLAHRMIKAGSSDSKFLRQIFVSVDITAPLYWQVSFCQ